MNPNRTTCPICRRSVPVSPTGEVVFHLRLNAGRLEHCPGGK